MTPEATILIAEDDDGHAALIERNLLRSGLAGKCLRLRDGQETLDFLFRRGEGITRGVGCSYVLILDINLPKVSGIEVLRQMKDHEELRKIPVTILSTTDDPHDVEQCHALGCSHYITKPTEPEVFVDVITRMAQLFEIVKIPSINECQ